MLKVEFSFPLLFVFFLNLHIFCIRSSLKSFLFTVLLVVFLSVQVVQAQESCWIEECRQHVLDGICTVAFCSASNYALSILLLGDYHRSGSLLNAILNDFNLRTVSADRALRHHSFEGA